MAALVDTKVLVYRFDPRFPDKQRIATDVLRRGIAEDSRDQPLAFRRAKHKPDQVASIAAIL